MGDSYENMSDTQLVRLSLDNSDRFYYLIKRYEPRLLRYIRRSTDAGREEAEDLLQEIFIKIYRNLNGFNQKLKFSSWAYRIARNEIINQFHKKKAYTSKIGLNIDDNDNNLTDFVTDALDLQDSYISRENAEKVKVALAELPTKYRDVLILRYFEDKNYNEISDILRKPPGTVATLINRAKSGFKKIARRHQLESLI
ncbi:RNA polymerase sigma factor [Desulfococcaceae bacterium HSG7]|nr:RNA polymerase sigma factor [Desulfococcaceae bacterium HSG7]